MMNHPVKSKSASLLHAVAWLLRPFVLLSLAYYISGQTRAVYGSTATGTTSNDCDVMSLQRTIGTNPPVTYSEMPELSVGDAKLYETESTVNEEAYAGVTYPRLEVKLNSLDQSPSEVVYVAYCIRSARATAGSVEPVVGQLGRSYTGSKWIKLSPKMIGWQYFPVPNLGNSSSSGTQSLVFFFKEVDQAHYSKFGLEETRLAKDMGTLSLQYEIILTIIYHGYAASSDARRSDYYHATLPLLITLPHQGDDYSRWNQPIYCSQFPAEAAAMAAACSTKSP